MLSGIADAVVYSERPEVVRLVADILRKKGVANLIIADTREVCLDGLKRFAKALLIVDWLSGDRNVVGLLSVNGRQPLGRQRPIMLIAEQATAQLVAICAEYSVTQIYTEPLTPKNLSSRLTALLIGESAPDDVRRVLMEVGEMRTSGSLSDGATLIKLQLKKHPNNLKLKCELAELLLSLGHTEEALTHLKGMEHTSPLYLRGIHLLGRALLRLGQAEAAHRVMSMAQLFNEQDPDRLVDIGQALLSLDRFKEARKSFDGALAVEPNHKGAKVGKGQSLLMDGAVNEALTVLKESSTELELASIFNTCAVMNMRKGRHQVGMNLYQSALVAVGSSPKLKSRLYFNMGLGYRRWGKKDKAIDSMEKARALDPAFKKIDQQLREIRGGDKKSPETVVPNVEIIEDHQGYAEVTSDFSDTMDFATDFSKLMDGDLEETLFSKPTQGDSKKKTPTSA